MKPDKLAQEQAQAQALQTQPAQQPVKSEQPAQAEQEPKKPNPRTWGLLDDFTWSY